MEVAQKTKTENCNFFNIRLLSAENLIKNSFILVSIAYPVAFQRTSFQNPNLNSSSKLSKLHQLVMSMQLSI